MLERKIDKDAMSYMACVRSLWNISSDKISESSVHVPEWFSNLSYIFLFSVIPLTILFFTNSSDKEGIVYSVIVPVCYALVAGLVFFFLLPLVLYFILKKQ
ncbi:MAG: hypothetical protein AB2810_18725 [Candidatus Thiodiazotropha endolucinida]